MKQLESEEIEAKATRMSAREKIAELESALANQGDLEEELTALRIKLQLRK